MIKGGPGSVGEPERADTIGSPRDGEDTARPEPKSEALSGDTVSRDTLSGETASGDALSREDKGPWAHPMAVSTIAVTFLALMGLMASAYLSGASSVAAATPASASANQELLTRIMSLGPNEQMELNNEQVSQLRDLGWSCPDFASSGFSVEWTTAAMVNGLPTVRRILSYGPDNKLAVYEQHNPDQQSGDVPLDIFTGQKVTEAGYLQDETPDRTMWLDDGPPWTAIITSQEVTYTFVSNLPLRWIPTITGRTAFNDSTKLADVPATLDNSVPARIGRGFDRIFAGIFA